MLFMQLVPEIDVPTQDGGSVWLLTPQRSSPGREMGRSSRELGSEGRGHAPTAGSATAAVDGAAGGGGGEGAGAGEGEGEAGGEGARGEEAWKGGYDRALSEYLRRVGSAEPPAFAALRDQATLTNDDDDDEKEAKESDESEKQKKPSKAMARKAKRAAEEAAREARIAAEKAALGPSAQAMESEVLRSRLAPLGLRVKEIRADGHCLYRSIDDQLVKVTGSGHEGGYEGLRATCAATMRDDEDSFRPFIGDCAEQTPEADERWRAYVREVESTATWGGQLEIMALSKALRRRIQVFSATMPVVVMGEDFDEDGALRVAYHRHAFGLGEHYNSVEDDKK